MIKQATSSVYCPKGHLCYVEIGNSTFACPTCDAEYLDRNTQSSVPAPAAVTTLDELLEKARHHVMTDEEKQAQRESWARGEQALGEYERGMTTSFAPERPVTPQAAPGVSEPQFLAEKIVELIYSKAMVTQRLCWSDQKEKMAAEVAALLAIPAAVTPQAEPGPARLKHKHQAVFSATCPDCQAEGALPHVYESAPQAEPGASEPHDLAEVIIGNLDAICDRNHVSVAADVRNYLRGAIAAVPQASAGLSDEEIARKTKEILERLDALVHDVAHGANFEKGKFYDWIHREARPLFAAIAEARQRDGEQLRLLREENDVNYQLRCKHFATKQAAEERIAELERERDIMDIRKGKAEARADQESYAASKLAEGVIKCRNERDALQRELLAKSSDWTLLKDDYDSLAATLEKVRKTLVAWSNKELSSSRPYQRISHEEIAAALASITPATATSTEEAE